MTTIGILALLTGAVFFIVGYSDPEEDKPLLMVFSFIAMVVGFIIIFKSIG